MSDRVRSILGRIPLHTVIVLLCLVWITPTVGLLVASFRRDLPRRLLAKEALIGCRRSSSYPPG